MGSTDSLLQMRRLTKQFWLNRKQSVKAVQEVTLTIHRGETLGIVGESGCGKSTLGRMLTLLYPPTSGELIYDGQRIQAMDREERRQYARRVQMIFQDPYASLNPRMKVRQIIAEGIDIHRLAKKREAEQPVRELLQTVGLSEAYLERYPHELSGGQRQRVGIARALAVQPELIVADEPISALDVSIQAQIINTLQRLQKEKGLTYLLIAHHLAVVRYVSDRIGVMYLGHLVELAESEALYQDPLHPYTQALLSAIPIPDPHLAKKRRRIRLEGEMPSSLSPPSGCPFRTRCPEATGICAEKKPDWREVRSKHWVACHLR